MWIRSQSKKVLINVNRVEAWSCVDHHYHKVCGEGYELGTYSTIEKAIKVLDMIENFINNTPNGIFQMPQDEDIETLEDMYNDDSNEGEDF